MSTTQKNKTGEFWELSRGCRRCNRTATLLIAATLLVACADSARKPEATREYLDPLTGLTITALAQPLVLAHTEPRISRSLRDYLYVGPVEVNRMGKRSYYLWIGPFSTIDRASVIFSRITLKAGDTSTELDMAANERNTAGLKTTPYTLPLGNTPGYYLPLAAEMLITMTTANAITIEAHSENQTRVYTLWSGETATLRQFADAVNLHAVRTQ